MKFVIDIEKMKSAPVGTINPKILADPNILLPKRSTKGSAGYDIKIPVDINFRMASMHVTPTIAFDTFIKIEDIPSDMVALVFARSSVGIEKGMLLDNAVAVIDSDYKDTIRIYLHSIDARSYTEFKAGDRVAQIVFVKHYLVDDDIEPVAVRDGGLGSTGK